MNDLAHFSDTGRACMADVSAMAEQPVSPSPASGVLRMQPAMPERIRSGKIAKVDILTVADVGAVMAAKCTREYWLRSPLTNKLKL